MACSCKCILIVSCPHFVLIIGYSAVLIIPDLFGRVTVLSWESTIIRFTTWSDGLNRRGWSSHVSILGQWVLIFVWFSQWTFLPIYVPQGLIHTCQRGIGLRLKSLMIWLNWILLRSGFDCWDLKIRHLDWSLGCLLSFNLVILLILCENTTNQIQPCLVWFILTISSLRSHSIIAGVFEPYFDLWDKLIGR